MQHIPLLLETVFTFDLIELLHRQLSNRCGFVHQNQLCVQIWQSHRCRTQTNKRAHLKLGVHVADGQSSTVDLIAARKRTAGEEQSAGIALRVVILRSSLRTFSRRQLQRRHASAVNIYGIARWSWRTGRT